MSVKKPVIAVIGLCGDSVFLQVDHFHAPGETVHAAGLYSEPGGKGYNQAVAAARLGAKVNFFGCIGDDAAGKKCEDFLRNEGISPYFQKVPDASTAYASILTDRNGDNRVTVYRGAADELSPELIRSHEEVIAGSDALLLNFEYPMAVNLAALELAEKNGVKVILNPAPAMKCGKNFLKKIWCMTPNESESAILGEQTEREVITMGGKGCTVLENGKKTFLPAKKVPAKDTTGAGDCFSAAFTVAVCEGKSLTEAAEFAQECAAVSVTRRYVMPSLPYRDEISENP